MISKLPQEILIYVLSYLSFVDILTCRRVNHFFNNVILHSAFLEYLIELQSSGYEDNPSSKLTVSEKVSLLRATEAAWKLLIFGRATSIRFTSFKPSSLYDFTGGVLMLGEAPENPMSHWTQALRWIQLSSIYQRNHDDIDWNRIDVHAEIIDFGLAVQEHDLAAIATYNVESDGLTVFVNLHLIQISKGTPHPLASEAVLRITEAPIAVIHHCFISIEIIGDTLGIILTFISADFHERTEVYFYDWKSGKKIASRDTPPETYFSFVFISQDMLSCPAVPKIAWSYVASAQPSLILDLPQLSNGYHVTQIMCRSEPKPYASFDYTSPLNCTTPFQPNGSDAVVLFDIHITHPFNIHDFFTLVVHRSSLLALLDDMPTTMPSTLSVPWSIWGPKICRWLPNEGIPNTWITVSCGQRYITMEKESEDDARPITVYDFNRSSFRKSYSCFPLVQRFGQTTLGGIEYGIGVVDEPSVLNTDVFAIPPGPVSSSLPYQKGCTSEQYWYSAVLLDQDKIVGVMVDDEDRIVELAVHTVGPRSYISTRRDTQ
ncbi:hypothetical protein A0H81_11045 [Grifola frondosa]|uniref:F-box domain-containing protein n=1 Tax=Grifola frondosa TaxID=5627 RepID=A0A1C7LVK3_GRIFR|nr:hypothetical protein A0H81_11045 [Grifola frondosa]